MATARRLPKKMMTYRSDKGVFGKVVENKPDEFKIGDPVLLSDRAVYGLMWTFPTSLSSLKRAIVTKFTATDPHYSKNIWVQIEFLDFYTPLTVLVKKTDLIKLIK